MPPRYVPKQQYVPMQVTSPEFGEVAPVLYFARWIARIYDLDLRSAKQQIYHAVRHGRGVLRDFQFELVQEGRPL
jgi:hypothetical protein